MTGESHRFRFFINVGLICASGAIARHWIPYFYEVAGLGGAAVAVNYILQLIGSSRLEQLHAMIDGVIASRAMTVVSSLLLAAAVLTAPRYARLDLVAGAGEYEVSVRGLNAETLAHAVVGPNQPRKEMIPTGWFGSREVRIKPAGLPMQRVTLAGFWSKEVRVPESFLRRPVVLARPDERNPWFVTTDRTIQVLVNGETIASQDGYRGQAVWIGVEGDVAVPAEVLESWRTRLASLPNPEVAESLIRRWSKPVYLARDASLPLGAVVRLEVLDASGALFARAQTRLPESVATLRFPEEMVMR